MKLAAILAAVFLAPLAPALNCRDVACCVSGSDSSQATAAPEENPQKSAIDPSAANGTDAKQSDSKTTEETPSAQKAEEPSEQKAPNSPSAAGVRKRRSRTKKPASPTTNGEPRKIVIRQGGASELGAQIALGITQEEANHQRERAEQLLAAAESSLKQLADRSLNPNRQEMVVQIRQYMDGARSALKESDTQRAHTLALKAYLVSDDLVKH